MQKEIHTVKLTLWSYAAAIGTAWVDSLEEIDDDLAECAREDGGGWGHLDISDIGGELTVDGKEVKVDWENVRRVYFCNENNWSDFADKIGIYSVDIDKAYGTATFTISGDFDPDKLTFFYTSAIGPGYLRYPVFSVDLLERVAYDDAIIEIEDGTDRNSKGCVFAVFDNGKYAEYRSGCNVNELEWKPFPDDVFGGDQDFTYWKMWSEKVWKYYEEKLSKDDSGVFEQWKEALDDESFNQVDFLVRACRRNADWAMLVSWEWLDVLREIPNLIEKPGIVDLVVEYCNDSFVEGDGFYEDDWCCELYTQDGDSDGSVNRWAYLLMQCPQLSDRCKTYEKFNGYSRCRLIEKNKMFAEKFSMEELGDPKSACWSTCSEDDYSSAWDCLIEEHPEFSKYRK